MIAYFTASVIGKRYNLKNYERIVAYLKQKGLTVISDHILKTTETEIKTEDKTARLSFQKKLEAWITGAHFVISETSYPSTLDLKFRMRWRITNRCYCSIITTVRHRHSWPSILTKN